MQNIKKIILVIITLLLINILQLFSKGDSEMQKQEVTMTLEHSGIPIKINEKFLLTVIFKNNTKSTFAFSHYFAKVEDSIHIYSGQNEEIHLSTRGIIDPKIIPTEEMFFQLKPGKSKSFHLPFELTVKENMHYLEHKNLWEHFIFPLDIKEIYFKAIFNSGKHSIELGEEELGYNVYNETLESNKIKIRIDG